MCKHFMHMFKYFHPLLVILKNIILYFEIQESFDMCMFFCHHDILCSIFVFSLSICLILVKIQSKDACHVQIYMYE